MQRLYGVSSGNGNDGVSHMFADYYVMTDDPWKLARLAMVDSFKPEYMLEALEALEVDGEAEYTITACILDPLDQEQEAAEQGEAWHDFNGAWFLIDVFPEDSPRDGRPMFDSIEEAFTYPALALIATEEERAMRHTTWGADTGHPFGYFACADCGEAIALPDRATFGAAGYARLDDGRQVCYACCAIRDRQDMRATGKATLYLTKDAKGQWSVGNWPGTLRINTAPPMPSRHNIAGRRYDVWFRFEGQPWHGVQYGDNTQIVHCKRTKG
jgi:hypothetical protein